MVAKVSYAPLSQGNIFLFFHQKKVVLNLSGILESLKTSKVLKTFALDLPPSEILDFNGDSSRTQKIANTNKSVIGLV